MRGGRLSALWTTTADCAAVTQSIRGQERNEFRSTVSLVDRFTVLLIYLSH